MIKAFLSANIALAAITGVDRTQTEEEYWRMWSQFKTYRHGGEFLTQQEHNSRFEIFKDNVDTITRHNEKGLSWHMGVTKFADMTKEEFGDYISTDCKPSFKAMRAKNKVEKMLKERENPGAKDAPWKNPTSIDWDLSGYVTPVKNQGGCGSCWAFSTTGGLESRFAIANGQSELRQLSEEELVECADSYGNAGCNGGLMSFGIEYARDNNGLALETEYTYTSAGGTRGSCTASSYTHYDHPEGYSMVTADSTNALETAVAEGPVSIAIEADQSSFQFYAGGVLTGDCGDSLDHGVLVVGYGTDNGDDYWKVKNSWGETWGESGYIRLCKNCGKNSGAGQCGILASAVYPTM